MTCLTLAFAHDKSDLISRVMAWFSFADYTHVAVVNGDSVIEASGVGHPHGVRMANLYDWNDKHPSAVFRSMPHPAPELVWELLQDEIGKAYDWSWLGRYLMRRDWRKNDKWTCSELISYACERAGKPLFAGEHLNRVTPQMLYMISEAA